MGIRTRIAALAKRLRILAGLTPGHPGYAVLVALYSIILLTTMVLAFAWLSDTPLQCITGGVCDP